MWGVPVSVLPKTLVVIVSNNLPFMKWIGIEKGGYIFTDDTFRQKGVKKYEFTIDSYCFR